MKDKLRGKLEASAKELVKRHPNIITPLVSACDELHLVGGGLYRPLIHDVYGVPLKDCDLDFVAVDIALEKLPVTWGVQQHIPNESPAGCTCWEMSADGTIFHLGLLRHHAAIIQTGAEPSISAYLEGVPLSIYSIAYDISKGKLIGEVGIRSIAERAIWINNPARFAMRKIYSKALYIRSNELGFKVIQKS